MDVHVFDWHTEIILTDEEVTALCSPGKGSDTCVWLAVGISGWGCLCYNRPLALVERFKAGETTAKRDGCDFVNNLDIGKLSLGYNKITVPK